MVGSVNLPQQEKRETERRKAHLGNGRGLFPGLPRNRGTRQRLSASRRGVFNPWSALPGTWLLAISRRSPVPVQPASVADPVTGRAETQGLPSACLRGTSPGAASTFGLPLRPALALPRFRTPHEA